MAAVPMCPGCRAILGPGDAVCPYCGWNVEQTEIRRLGGIVERAARPFGGAVNLLIAANVLAAVVTALADVRISPSAGGPAAQGPVEKVLDGVLGPSGATLFRLGSVVPGNVLAEGEAWRLFTSVFLHFGLFHLAMNMLSLRNLGTLVEEAFGAGKAVALFLLTGLGGGLLALGWFLLRAVLGMKPESFNMAGASGAICGYAGLLAALGFRIGGEQGKRLWTSMVKPVAIILGLGLVLEFTHASFRLANAAHLGGFLTGLGAGFLCSFGIRSRGNPATVKAWDAAAIALSLATAASFVPPLLALASGDR